MMAEKYLIFQDGSLERVRAAAQCQKDEVGTEEDEMDDKEKTDNEPVTTTLIIAILIIVAIIGVVCGTSIYKSRRRL